MINLIALFSQIPNTGDNFPVIPLVIVGVIAIIVAIVSAVLSKKKK
ncbi:MAG: LPXTG cell wall anchor domain-containing protein [Ruminococcus flavefaciens]|nr:LPXTG cell wall anchor domain-containing protein [Ruminococcus flavefaciens]MCM1230473.1 LPXTG cell wall anchor domain-containing protein [Ruminococcus flavefaciens]